MAFFNTTLSTLFILALVVSLSSTTAHLSSDDDSTVDISFNDAIASVINDVHTSSSPTTLPSKETVDNIYGSGSPTTLPDDEASAKAPSPDIMVPFPFNFAPITDDIDTSIPADEEQKDNMFVEKYLQMAVDNTQSFLSDVWQKKLEEEDDECAAICEQVMLSANDALTQGLISIGAKEYSAADAEVRAFSSDIKTCIKCYGGAADPELLKFVNWVSGVSDACLGKITKYEH